MDNALGLSAFGVLGVFVGAIIVITIVRDKTKQNYKKFIDQYLKAETVIHQHIREHVLRDKDLSWAIGVPPIVTIGIKADGTLMSDGEFAEARRLAGLSEADQADCSP